MSETHYGLLLLALLSLAFTRLLMSQWLTRHVMDMPNERSSHVRPTPRGGGVAIVLAFYVGLAVLRGLDLIAHEHFIALLGGLPVALVGFIDDLKPLPAGLRLAVHVAAAVWVLAWLHGLPAGMLQLPQWLVFTGTVLYTVWLLNLYNFMDGIDGLAGLQAITTAAGGILLYALVAPGSGAWLIPALLLASTAGFLFWNFPPARIFMGDAGSGFLGMVLAILCIAAARAAPQLFWAWNILLAAFICDATFTLIRRLVRGRRPYEAHRTHAYQHAARAAGSHRTVSLVVTAINIGWLIPLSVLVALQWLAPWLGLLLAFGPLLWLAWRFDAGVDEGGR